MKRIIAFLLAIVCAGTLMLSGCTRYPSSDGASAETITVTDHSGNIVTLPTQIDRIAVCDIHPLPSVLAIFFNSADKIIAMSPTSMSAAQNGLLAELYPEIRNADTSAFSGKDVNAEELMKLNPQVVFYNASNAQLGESLRKSGFPAVAISVNNWDYNAVETLNQWIDLLSQIFPDYAEDRATLVREYSENSLKLVQERTQNLTEDARKKIFFLFQYSADGIVTGGQKSFGQWWADTIGAVNAAKELEENNSVKVTLEQVYSWNPDQILISNFTTSFPEDLYGNTVGNYDWSGLTAVQNQIVDKMPLGMYRSYTPCVDTPITLLWLAKTVYPDLFADLDITQKTMEYYETVFGVKLTAEQAESIFAPASSAGKIGV